MHKPFIRLAATASNVLGGKFFTVRKSPFSRNVSLVKIR
jgi:hypothetical protein